MKYLVLIGDGMADYPLEDYGNRTPLAVAKTPAMDEIARAGISGLFRPIPEGFAPGSDIGNLSLFGYAPAQTFTGRAPLEAVNRGIALGPDEVAFRCNLVTLQDGLMANFTAGHISDAEAAPLVASLEKALGTSSVHFHPGVGYRHLTILSAPDGQAELLAAVECTPPHDISERPYEAHLPKGPESERVLTLMTASQAVLQDHEVNAARTAAGLAPATSIWLWGQGQAPEMPTFKARFGLSGAVISAVDLVNGIGRCAGLEVIRVPGATGYLDTAYEGKVAAALEALERLDFVFLHVEAPDEVSHEGNASLKIEAIEAFDQRVVAPCLAATKARGDCRLLVAPDHITALSTRTHASGPVPFALCGAGVTPDERSCYSEEEAAKAGVLYPEGHGLVPDMIEAVQLGPGT